MSDNNIAAKGDFRGDFSRDTFDPMKHFSRVLMQQGRVQLDADWNEQVSILLHYMRQLGRDLMGPHGAPYPDDVTANPELELKNFKIKAAVNQPKPDFTIADGRYYVNGVLCEIREEQKISYRNQPNYPITETEELGDGMYLVYLDVWERHLTYVEDDDIREKALGGADTASRAQIVWQVKTMAKPIPAIETKWKTFDGAPNIYQSFLDVLADQMRPGTGQLKSRAKKASEGDTNPCQTAPEASYRGAENQLYRVEIHNPRIAGKEATFKWSRENGAVIFPITNIGTDQITLEHLGRDDRFGLQPGDWVEVLDDDVVLRNEANPLLQVKEVDRENLQVALTLNGIRSSFLDKIATGIKENKTDKHPYLRRWDQKKNVNEDGVIPLTEGYGENSWISLEDGIEIQFYHQLEMKLRPKDVLALTGEETPVARLPQTTAAVVVYQTGDYWLIPARTATGDVEWPGPVGNPEAIPPHGVQHHYAPLAIINLKNGEVVDPKDLRRQLKQGWEPSAQ